MPLQSGAQKNPKIQFSKSPTNPHEIQSSRFITVPLANIDATKIPIKIDREYVANIRNPPCGINASKISSRNIDVNIAMRSKSVTDVLPFLSAFTIFCRTLDVRPPARLKGC